MYICTLHLKYVYAYVCLDLCYVCMCIYVRKYVCMYACNISMMYVYKYYACNVCTYVCTNVLMNVRTYVPVPLAARSKA
jgi:hypothetical protein